MALTRKQTEVLGFIREFIADRSFAPTLEEIAKNFSVSTVTAHEHVRQLEKKGEIRTERNRARSIELVESDSGGVGSLRVPMLGRIAAGLPIEAVETRSEFDFTSFFPEGRSCYVLEVKGNSMIEDHIQDGDLVLVEHREQALAGETVVALVREEEATLKRFYPEGSQVRLEPANAAMKAIIVPKSEVRVQGVVIGVMRRY